MTTRLFLVRHGATAYNLAQPPRLQGRGIDMALAPAGVRQAELTRDFLAICPMDACYSSPMERAMQTASIIAAPHRLDPGPVPELTECDVGAWEGLSWPDIAARYPTQHRLFHDNPAQFGYLGGETFADVQARAMRAIDELLARHEGKTLLVVAHHVVNRTYLAGVMGLGPEQARRITVENCGVSVVIRAAGRTSVQTLNSHFHLLGAAA
jgi:broad specificity phosphatase PhoE